MCGKICQYDARADLRIISTQREDHKSEAISLREDQQTEINNSVLPIELT